jgi:ribose transport system substrate-binding protein
MNNQVATSSTPVTLRSRSYTQGNSQADIRTGSPLQRRSNAHGAIAKALAAICVLGVGASQPAAVAADKPKTAMSMSFLASPFFVVLTDLVTKEAKETGLNWTQTTDAQSDAGKQISDIQALVNSGVKGLIVVPRDSDAIAPALNFAQTNGVTVVAVDVGINTGKAAMTIRADNVAMAQSAADEIGQHLNGKGKILELQGDLLNTSGRERTEGFEQRMKEKYPGIQIIARPTRWEQARAADATQTILTATPDLDAIYMQSDSIMLPGVLSVLQQLGHGAKVGEPKHIFLVSIDGSPFSLEKIRSKELDAAVSQPLDLYAKYAVSYLQKAMAGEKFSPGPTDHNSRIVANTAGNLEDLLPAPVATIENVSDPKLWGNQAK